MTTIVVAGALANKPGNGGEAWVRMSWVTGLRRLGFDVWLIEQLGTPELTPAATEWFHSVCDRFGLGHQRALVDADGGALAGTELESFRDAASEAALLINISGNLAVPGLLGLIGRRAYLDLDPGYTQYWDRAGDLGTSLDAHQALLTVALSVAGPGCRLPLGGRRWRSVAPPTVLDDWPVPTQPGRGFTTVASWRGGYGALETDGHRFGTKAHEFRRFAGVPRQAGVPFQMALDIHPADPADADRLRSGGWSLVDPAVVAGDPDAFRDYVQASAAEFSPAQGIYVETRCGWFGDRTTRYLASGRPAVVQDTGLPDDLVTGEGLLVFRDPDGAQAAVSAVLRDYGRHAAAARQLAEEHFDANRVLTGLLEDLLP